MWKLHSPAEMREGGQCQWTKMTTIWMAHHCAAMSGSGRSNPHAGCMVVGVSCDAVHIFMWWQETWENMASWLLRRWLQFWPCGGVGDKLGAWAQYALVAIEWVGLPWRSVEGCQVWDWWQKLAVVSWHFGQFIALRPITLKWRSGVSWMSRLVRYVHNPYVHHLSI